MVHLIDVNIDATSNIMQSDKTICSGFVLSQIITIYTGFLLFVNTI